MKFLKENGTSLLTILFLIVVGILLLVNPSVYGIAIIKIVGLLLAVLGVFDLIKYFRAKPEEAAKGTAFYSGALMVTLGFFCIFGSKWFVNAFPVLAVLYGLFQVLLGFRKLQRTVDALRIKQPLWYIKAISAGLSLLAGFLIAFNPNMAWISIWVFTGVTMIVEGVIDAVALGLQQKKAQKTKTA